MVDLVTAGPDDWALVRDVRLRALTDSPDSFGATLAQAQAQPQQVWRDRLTVPSPTLLAVAADGTGVGMGGAFVPPTADTGADADRAWLWGMWADPAVRGQGVGRRILDRLVVWAQDAGRTPYLHVTEGNETARALYVSCGFVATGVWEPLREGSPLRIEEMVLRRG